MGVRSFGHAKRDDTGKAHPAKIKSGIPLVGDKGGSATKIPTDYHGDAKTSVPKNARRGDGTSNLGTKTVHKHGAPGGPKTSAHNAKPSNVKVADGVSVPRKIR